MPTIEDLLFILPTIRESAIHAEDIAEKLDLPTKGNQVGTRQLIRQAIRNGYTIVSNTKIGYWLSSDKAEIQEYIESLKNRAIDTKSRAEELREAWNNANPENQIND